MSTLSQMQGSQSKTLSTSEKSAAAVASDPAYEATLRSVSSGVNDILSERIRAELKQGPSHAIADFNRRRTRGLACPVQTIDLATAVESRIMIDPAMLIHLRAQGKRLHQSTAHTTVSSGPGSTSTFTQRKNAELVSSHLHDERFRRLGMRADALSSYESKLVNALQTARQRQQPTLRGMDEPEIRDVLRKTMRAVPRCDCAQIYRKLGIRDACTAAKRVVAEAFFTIAEIDLDGDGVLSDDELDIILGYVVEDYHSLLSRTDTQPASSSPSPSAGSTPRSYGVTVSGHLDASYNGVYELATTSTHFVKWPTTETGEPRHLYQLPEEEGTREWVFNRRHEPWQTDAGSAFAAAPDGGSGTAATGYLVRANFEGVRWQCFDGADWKENVPIQVEYMYPSASKKD